MRLIARLSKINSQILVVQWKMHLFVLNGKQRSRSFWLTTCRLCSWRTNHKNVTIDIDCVRIGKQTLNFLWLKDSKTNIFLYRYTENNRTISMFIIASFAISQVQQSPAFFLRSSVDQTFVLLIFLFGKSLLKIKSKLNSPKHKVLSNESKLNKMVSMS